MNGIRLLEEAQRIFINRRTNYGHPKNHIVEVANRWSLILGKEVAPHQVAMCMIELKLTRLKHRPNHVDSITDIAGYAAVMVEVIADSRHGEPSHE